MDLSDVYSIEEIFPILSDYEVSDWFSVIVYSDKAPSVGDKILIENKVYNAQIVEDDTTDEEYREGLTFSKVWFCLVEEN